jgi:hypothetical protein
MSLSKLTMPIVSEIKGKKIKNKVLKSTNQYVVLQQLVFF